MGSLVIPVLALLGASNTSRAYENFKGSVFDFIEQNVKGVDATLPEDPSQWMLTKEYSESQYVCFHSLGLSLCFDHLPNKSVIGAIHIENKGLNNLLDLPGKLKIGEPIASVIDRWGQPQKKSGGGTSDICISYEPMPADSPDEYREIPLGVQLEFESRAWDDGEAMTKGISYYVCGTPSVR